MQPNVFFSWGNLTNFQKLLLIKELYYIFKASLHFFSSFLRSVYLRLLDNQPWSIVKNNKVKVYLIFLEPWSPSSLFFFFFFDKINIYIIILIWFIVVLPWKMFQTTRMSQDIQGTRQNIFINVTSNMMASNHFIT